MNRYLSFPYKMLKENLFCPLFSYLLLKFWKLLILFFVYRNADGETVYMCIPTEESEHIAAMKRREKTKKARRGKPARVCTKCFSDNWWSLLKKKENKYNDVSSFLLRNILVKKYNVIIILLRNKFALYLYCKT